LKFEHYHPQTGELRIVKSKNNRSRTITLSGPSKVDFEAWLKIRGTKPGPVFCKIDKIGGLHQDGKFVSPGMIQKRLTMRVRIADIKACTWHDGRRTVLTNLIRLGYLEDAQELAGHTQLATTLSYARYDSERSAEALSALDEFQSEKPEGDENSSE
jgi:integrase